MPVLGEGGYATLRHHRNPYTRVAGSPSLTPRQTDGANVGLPPKVVQTLLGHSSIVMTLDVYGHLFRDGGDRTELTEGVAPAAGVIRKGNDNA
jgi:integrase